MYDTDTAYKKTSYLWRRLGALYEKAATKDAERGFYDSAFKAAQMAEACYWQASGEGDPVSLKDMRPQSEVTK